MDTTNVKSNIEQGPFRDAYVAGLKDVYENGYTDLNGNNIFNSLFWYNLIVNKNNITKNSYAKLIGDVMWQNGPAENVYSRLLLLKGKIGKSTKVQLNIGSEPGSDSFYKMSIAGINFNLKSLFLDHEIGRTVKLPPVQDDGGNEYQPDTEGYDQADYGPDTDDTDYSDGGLFTHESDVSDDSYEAFGDDGEQDPKKRNTLTVVREKQQGVPGTNVILTLNKRAEQQRVVGPSIALPMSGDRNPEISKEIGYNPFEQKPVELRPDQNQSYNYYKMAIGSIHDLLSRLGDAVTVEIQKGDGEYEVFDKTKDYDC
jgi:hypothetical protein